MPNSVSSSRREQLLQQMGITQYELRRPMALQGEVAISLPAQTRLIVIIQQQPDRQHSLFQDILRSLSLTQQQIYCLTPEQAVMLPESHALALWLVGEFSLPETLTNQRLLLTSPALVDLANDPISKRALWQQICHHENYFTPHA